MALPDRFWPTRCAIATLASRAKCVLLAWWVIILPLSLPSSAQDLPAGTTLEAQLSIATGSRISRPGEPIEATIIAPVSAGGRILIPDGSVVSGVIENVTAIGLGLKHTTASIGYNFDALRLANGETVRIKSKVVEVETAKERVDITGTVQGIHPIASVSSMLDLVVVPLLFATPPVGAPVWATKSLIAPPANPEIYFPPGTEVILRLEAGVNIPGANTQPLRIAPFSPGEVAEIHDLQKNSAQRARQGSYPSNLVNILFLGSRQQLDRAFHAAGWSMTEKKSAMSLYRMYYALTVRIGYKRAPMDTLTLNGVPSAFEYQKSLDTVEKRHHVRLWQEPQRVNVWLGTAAEDVAFRFEVTHWTHSSDPRIDEERAKVVDDLAFTGCLDRAELLTRNLGNVLQDPKKGRPILTDGRIVVLGLNDCSSPKIMVGVDTALPSHPQGRLSRALISFRKGLLGSSNILFNTYNALKYVSERELSRRATQPPNISPPERRLDWLSSLASPGSEQP
ncbi:MAG TPA: LssY C-terminal domain-containing protein [Bryobacteraceae bacterium]|nr:LssY C-terminal domain-containing protein [Bryobacteraceae bacterium]